ncbi:MAG: C39 family peptidase, partial [Candidatus Sericytochromatia bacterium]
NRFKLANLPGGRELQSFADGSRVLKDVPFFQQGRDNTCGQAVMAVLLNYWETKVPYQTVVDDANRFNLPTTHEGLTSYMQRQGLKARAYRQGNVDFLKERVDEGRPPIVLLEFNNDLFQQHYVVVIGYNEAKGTIIFHDSIDGPYRQLDEDTFFAMWQAENLVKLPLFGGANYQGLVIDVERSARR